MISAYIMLTEEASLSFTLEILRQAQDDSWQAQDDGSILRIPLPLSC